MLKFSRPIVLLTLVTLILNLGDWPFMDELLDQLEAQQQFAILAGTCREDLSSSDDTGASKSAYSTLEFQSLAALQIFPPTKNKSIDSIATAHIEFPAPLIPRSTFVPDGLFRPPAV